MSKVKIIQIAIGTDDYVNEYLDDQGRVWYHEAKFKTVQDATRPEQQVKIFDHYDWVMLDLPEEPVK